MKKNVKNKVYTKLLKAKVKIFNTAEHEVKIDKERFDEINIKYNKPEIVGHKYLNLKKHFHNYIYFAHLLYLNRMPNKRILDIGSGMGYFPFICNNYGHNAYGMDTGQEPLYNSMTKMLGVYIFRQFIAPYQEINPIKNKFNIVTAFRIVFDRYPNNLSELWNKEEWIYFLLDVKYKLLTNNGVICLMIDHSKYSKKNTNNIIKMLKEMNADFINGGEIIRLNYKDIY